MLERLRAALLCLRLTLAQHRLVAVEWDAEQRIARARRKLLRLEARAGRAHIHHGAAQAIATLVARRSVDR